MNHDWVKRRLAAILANMIVMQNSVHKNHYYGHEIFERSWAILSHLKTAEELAEMDFKQYFSWLMPPNQKFKKVQLPHLAPRSVSSSCSTDKNEDVEDSPASHLLHATPTTMLALLDTSILHHAFLSIFIALWAIITHCVTILMPILSYFIRFT